MTIMKGIKEASADTGLSYYFIRQLVLTNKIKYVRSGKKYMINMPSLYAFCEGGAD